MSFSRGIFLTHGSTPGLLHCGQIHYYLSYAGSSGYGGGVGVAESSGCGE